jgi:outer membrane protein assembly factor BamB
MENGEWTGIAKPDSIASDLDILENQDNHRRMSESRNPKIGFPKNLFVQSAVVPVAALFGLVAFFLAGCEKAAEDPNEGGAAAESPSLERDWPLFRGDAEMRGFTDEILPAPLKVAWTFAPPVEEGKRRPPIDASPVISGGRVFVGSQDGNFYAIDLKTGASIWTFKAEGPIIAPAAVLGERVFFGDTYGFVYALGVADGGEAWRFETEGKIEGGINTLTEGGQPDRIFVGSHDFFLYCLSAASGEVLWKHETGNYVVATPSMVRSADGRIDLTFGGCDGLLHVLPAKGEGGKREIEIGAYVANTSAVRDGICYVAHNGGEVVAIEIASGETVWKTKTGIEYTASPAVDEKRLYVAGPDKRLVAYDRVTGGEVWAFVSPRALSSSPLISGDLIWQGGMDGRLYAVKREDGSEAWNYDLGTQIKASPAASRGTLVVCGEDGVVYAFAK